MALAPRARQASVRTAAPQMISLRETAESSRHRELNSGASKEAFSGCIFTEELLATASVEEGGDAMSPASAAEAAGGAGFFVSGCTEPSDIHVSSVIGRLTGAADCGHGDHFSGQCNPALFRNDLPQLDLRSVIAVGSQL